MPGVPESSLDECKSHVFRCSYVDSVVSHVSGKCMLVELVLLQGEYRDIGWELTPGWGG